MIRSILLAVTSSLSVAQFAIAQTTVATDPVGFTKLTIKGKGADSPPALSFLGLAMTQPVLLQGTLSSANGSTLKDDEATWTDGQFNGANGTHYVEIIAGSGAGLMANITATSGANKTITLAEDLSAAVSNGTAYRIRKNWTLASVFGPNNEAGLGAGSASEADEVLVYDPTANPPGYTTYYYKNTSTLGGIGWRSTASTSVNQANAPFEPTSGILVRRRQPNDVTLSLAGAVKLGQTSYPVLPGLNIEGNIYPTDALTLGNSGLLASGLAGGTSTEADLVQIYDAAANPPAYRTYYYKNTTTLGGIGWRSTTSTSVDASGTVIASGTSIIVQRRQGRPSFEWVAPQPF